jgi:hypothetical protein
MFAELEDDQEIQETQGNAGLAILHQPYGMDDGDDSEVSTGFATSFASSFTSVGRGDPLHSRRQPQAPRTPPSPSSTRAKKR